MRPFPLLLLLLLATASIGTAQSYGGAYTGDSAAGPLRLDLVERGTNVTGVLTGPALRFELDGLVDPQAGAAAGTAFTAGGVLGFEAYLDGDVLGLYLFEMTAEGAPIVATAIELILRREPAPPPAPAGATPQGPSSGPGAAPGQNPAAVDPRMPAPPPPSAPAPTDPFVGTFTDGSVTLHLQGGGNPVEGRIETGGQVYPARGRSDGRVLRGAFTSAGQEFPFTAAFDGSTLTFETGGATYRLAPVAAVAAPPAARTGSGAPSGDDRVLAVGTYGRLTLDNALAFIEAVEFALAQIGYPYRFSTPERDELLNSFVAAYPLASQTDQAVLAQAREIWTNAQANWPRASEEDRRQFLLGVFALFFGEEAVAQWAATHSGGESARGGGSAPGCGTFEECTSAFVDERTWTETFNSQGCWAAAGCSDYSPSSGFTFERYD